MVVSRLDFLNHFESSYIAPVVLLGPREVSPDWNTNVEIESISVALHFQLQPNAQRVMTGLLAYDATTEDEDDFNRTPPQLARRSDHNAAVDLFET